MAAVILVFYFVTEIGDDEVERAYGIWYCHLFHIFICQLSCSMYLIDISIYIILTSIIDNGRLSEQRMF